MGALSLPPELVEVFRDERRFFLAAHEGPDGDALGSLLGLHFILERLGKESVRLLSREEVAEKYAFMPGMEGIPESLPPAEGVDARDAVFIALECPALERLGTFAESARAARRLVNIDHHPDNRGYGHLNLVAAEAPSTTAIIYALAKELGVEVEPDLATCLYVGLVTDTGRFQYENATPEAFELAAELVALGAKPHRVFQEIFERMGFGALKLLGTILSRAEYQPGPGLVWSLIRESDLAESGGEMRDTENFIDYLRSVEGARVAVLVKESSNGQYKVSLRSRGAVDVARIAHRMGGGGHHNASGFTTKVSLPELLEFIRSQLKE